MLLNLEIEEGRPSHYVPAKVGGHRRSRGVCEQRRGASCSDRSETSQAGRGVGLIYCPPVSALARAVRGGVNKNHASGCKLSNIIIIHHFVSL